MEERLRARIHPVPIRTPGSCVPALALSPGSNGIVCLIHPGRESVRPDSRLPSFRELIRKTYVLQETRERKNLSPRGLDCCEVAEQSTHSGRGQIRGSICADPKGQSQQVKRQVIVKPPAGNSGWAAGAPHHAHSQDGRSEITTVTGRPPTTKLSWRGKLPSGTAPASNLSLAASKRSHAGRPVPFT